MILCGANAYEEKYYFNPAFEGIPESIRQELRVICVLFTQEAGGIFTISFDDDGSVILTATADDDDITYDEVSAGLLTGEIRRKREELLEELSLFYRVMILHEDLSEAMSEV